MSSTGTPVTESPIRTVLLAYYFPQKSKVSPVLHLRRHGWVQFDGSVWIGHADAVPTLPIAEWEAVGARVQVVPFVDEQWQFVKQMTLSGLQRRAHEIRESLEQGLTSAAKVLEKAERLQSVGLVKAGVGRTRAHLRLAAKQLLYAQEAAMMFDLFGDVSELFSSMRGTLEALEQANMANVADAREQSKKYPGYEPPKRNAKFRPLATVSASEPTTEVEKPPIEMSSFREEQYDGGGVEAFLHFLSNEGS